MNILVFALIVIIIAALLVWAANEAPIPYPLNWIVRIAIILIAAVVIAERAGVV